MLRLNDFNKSGASNEGLVEFEQIALVHLDELYATALRYTKNEKDAEDLVQETFLKAFTNFHRYEKGTNCRAWLFTILTNTFINRFRRKKKEREILNDYLADRGKLFFMADIETPASYTEWLQPYGFKLGDGVIIDEDSAQVGAEPVTPIGVQYSPEHPITKMFRSRTAFTLARPVDIEGPELKGLTGESTVLIKTGDSAYLIPLAEILSGQSVTFSSEGKTPSSYALAAAGLYHPEAPSPSPSPSPDGNTEAPPVSSRIVVASSAETFSNAFLGLASNRDFALNSINWLAESESQITVRAKDPKVQPISLSKQSQTWLYFIFCLLIPFLSALTGILIAYFRRKGIAN